MQKSPQAAALVERNRQLHNTVAKQYHLIHDDIFNAHEQARIGRRLAEVRQALPPEAVALDFGCGSGNMTAHLRALEFKVVSADVADEFVALLSKRYESDPAVEPYLLSGDAAADLNGYEFDLICIYSVLHHLPDYLGVLLSLAARVRPGGYIYIDHEASESLWTNDPRYAELQRRVRWHKLRAQWRKVLSWSWYRTRIMMMRDPRYQQEGDIHVWPDDHIEWRRIRAMLGTAGFAEAYSEDYLCYRSHYPQDVFRAFAPVTSDMHCSVFKRQPL